MLLASEIQFLVGIAALCVFVILLCVEGSVRLRSLFKELTLLLDWRTDGISPLRAMTLRQIREARVFYHGLPADPRIPVEARIIARRFRRLSFLHLIAGWICWYVMLGLGAVAHLSPGIETALLALPPVAAVILRLSIQPWPGGDVWHGQAEAT
ncbi:MAG: hypothetical protein AAGE80_18705 [Pseudomonadota bacterium]